MHDFIEAPDRLRWFFFHAKNRAYVEVASYRKVLEDARKRNRVFFEKLNVDSL